MTSTSASWSASPTMGTTTTTAVTTPATTPAPATQQKQQKKLRASCDACGAAKLRCDRGQPSCGRCSHAGVPCRYGISRKNGRPRRTNKPGSVSSTATTTASASAPPMSTAATTVEGGVPPTSSTAEDHLASLWESINGVPSDSGMFLDAFDTLGVNHPGSLDLGPPAHLASSASSTSLQAAASLPSPEAFQQPLFSSNGSCSSPSIGPAMDLSQDFSHTHTPMPLSSMPTPFQHQNQHQQQFQQLRQDSLNITAHEECAAETHRLLASLAAESSSFEATAFSKVPLDQGLRFHRLAAETLSQLLSCPCAANPDMILQHASAVSRLLHWYRETAGCTHDDGSRCSYSPTDDSEGAGWDSSLFGAKDRCYSWSGSSGGSGANSTGRTSPSPGAGFAPLSVAIGSFDVDDARMRSALTLQLVLGEIRRIGQLIELFAASHRPMPSATSDEHSRTLFNCLDAWLRCEHAKTMDWIRGRLRSLN